VIIRDEYGFSLYERDHKTGVTKWRKLEDGKWIYRTDYPVDDVIAQNQFLQAEAQGRARQQGLGDMVAQIPLNIAYEQLTEAQSQGDEKYVAKWLNDGDNAAFRVRGGRV